MHMVLALFLKQPVCLTHGKSFQPPHLDNRQLLKQLTNLASDDFIAFQLPKYPG